MEGSARLKPNLQETPSNTYKIGEKVEAIWSSDGEKYPGRIVNVFPNDHYEVLFDDGVKSRRKASLIFKIQSETPPQSPLPILPPLQPQLKGRQNRLSAAKSSKQNKSQGVVRAATKKSSALLLSSPIPPPPPLISKMTNSRNAANEDGEDIILPSRSLSTISLLKEGTKLEATVTPRPPSLTPKPTIIDNNTNSSSKVEVKIETTIEGFNTNGTSSPKLTGDEGGDQSATTTTTHSENNSISNNSPSSNNGSSTKKGFVYVQQPHYSVFDPPPVDLGKRHRRVHNYSLLAKGPILKKGLLSANSNGIDELIDGESPTSTPSTSKPNSRCSSPSVTVNSPIINNLYCKSPSNATIMTTEASETPTVKRTTSLPTPPSSGGSTFVRKRRFLKSPPKTSNRLSSLPNSKTDAPEASNTSNISINVEPSPSTPVVTVSSSEPTTPKADISLLPLSPPLSQLNSIPISETAATVISDINSNASGFAVPRPLPVALPSPNDAEDVPSKRLRKPSLRFSAEEGYVDIFSQKRSRRSTPQRGRLSERREKTSLSPVKPHIPLPTETKSQGKRKSKKFTIPIEAPIVPEIFPALPPLTSISYDKSATPPTKLASPNCDPSLSKKGISKVKVIEMELDESEEEELLDVDEFMVIEKVPSKKSPKRSPNKIAGRHASGSSIPEKPSSHRKVITYTPSETVDISTTKSKPLVHPGPLRRTSRGRLVRPPNLKTDLLKEPSVLLDRLSVPQHLFKKCDSAFTSKRSASEVASSSNQVPKIKSQTKVTNEGAANLPDKPRDGILDSSVEALINACAFKSKKWRKKRWTKGRGLLPGIKSGMRVNDSQAMQLLKRSRFQRRFDNRGRPKVVLLKGITKKRLKRIQDSIRRRKIKRKNISVPTKFKDVRVDIINCVCGRTDEFGLMVQCEVCLCWQHGNCFKIFDGSMLPKFYVCESCASPKRVRPSYKTEGIRQETYKKGVLPSFPGAPKQSENHQRVIKRCNDLTKMVNSIDDAIRQNQLKELIGISEPEHKKLYQWSTPRTHPKDLIQKWQFNKYYKSVIRRLVIKHKGKLDYMDKFANHVAFREKLKKYSTAFDAAKLAISRKIGPRGLILVEKLSEQESKSKKIKKVKNKLDKELSQLPEVMKKCIMSQINNPTGQPFKFPVPPMEPTPCTSTTPHNQLASNTRISKFLVKYAELLNSDPEKELYEDEEAFDSLNSKPEIKTTEPTANKEDKKVASSITNNESADIAEEIIRFNLEQLNESDSPIKNVPEDPEEESWVQIKSTSGTSGTSDTADIIKLMIAKNKGTKEGGDAESESEATLSGDTTISVEDSEGGEEYWYNPISELNCEYDNMRRLLLHDALIEHDKKTDCVWRNRESLSLKHDWIDEVDFYINGDLGLGMDSLSESSDSEEEEDEKEEEEENEDTVVENVSESDVDEMDYEDIPYWRKALSVEMIKESDVEEDPEWKPDEDAFDSDSSEEEEDENSSNISTKPESIDSLNKNANREGLILVCGDPNVQPGEIVDACVKVDNRQIVLGKGIIVPGPQGTNFIKLATDKSEDKDELSNFENIPNFQLSLCKTCQDTFETKWNWKQLNASKGVNIVLEDTIQVLAEEIDRFKHLGLHSVDAKVHFKLPKFKRPRSSATKEHQFLAPLPKTKFEPGKLTELCRAILSKPRPKMQSTTKSTLHLASAEEESILSLLSLSKAPAECNNGENVSELSIESLRKLTERLQQNGPLSEDLAKAVTGPLLTNGKIGIQKSSSVTRPNQAEPVCVRCNLQQENAQNLYILVSSNPTLANSNLSPHELSLWCNKVSEAIEESRLSSHVFKRVLFPKIKKLAERKKAERTARELGIKVTPESVKKRIQIAKPYKYLNQLKSDYMEALMPYAEHFISRHTNKDDVINAKRKWASAMIEHYNHVKKTLKVMYGVKDEEGRIKKEDKFYGALDMLRKSFDIVLTKKDIKMRRQYPSLSQSDSIPLTENGNVIPILDVKEDEAKSNDFNLMSEDTSSVANNTNLILVNGLDNIHEEEEECSEDKMKNEAMESAIDIMNEDMSLLPPPDNNETTGETMMEVDESAKSDIDANQQMQELEILARLDTYPIQDEDVNAILGITSDNEIDTSANTNNNQTNQDQSMNPEDKPLELEDLRLVEENLSLKTDDNLLGFRGDFDLMNTIGTLGATGGSDLLLNVFDDPMFSDPEPTPCSSRSILKNHQPPPFQSSAPSLAKLTPEICRGFLIDDIRAHQSIIDLQLDKLEGEIIELERRRGNGLRNRDDSKQFEILHANMQILLENTEVLNQLVRNSVGHDDLKGKKGNLKKTPAQPGYTFEVKKEPLQKSSSRQDHLRECGDNSSAESDYYDDDMLFDKTA